MKKLLMIVTLLIAMPVTAEQFGIPTASEAQKLFWSELYPKNGWTLYCGEYFDSSRRKISIETLYSITWVADSLGCGTADNCRATDDRFNRIEADLHNFYPSRKNIIRARSNLNFGLVAGEFRDFFECDFEYEPSKKLAEPRPAARGNIARALIYMHAEYNLPLSAVSLGMFRKWNKIDPPSKDEIRRNDIIEKLQGTRNIFIDNPLQADETPLLPSVKPIKQPISKELLMESL